MMDRRIGFYPCLGRMILLFGLFWAGLGYCGEAEPVKAQTLIPFKDVVKKSPLQEYEAQLPKDAEGNIRALRQMRIYKIEELGLELWIENQPPWEIELQEEGRFPTVVTQSPPYYHPSAAMTFMSLPDERIASAQSLQITAETAIRRAGRNYGLSESRSQSLSIRSAQYGILQGYETEFVGRVGKDAADVRIFVGQAPDRFPVVLTIYTQKGKMEHLHENIRRSWNTVNYLPQKESGKKRNSQGK